MEPPPLPPADGNCQKSPFAVQAARASWGSAVLVFVLMGFGGLVVPAIILELVVGFLVCMGLLVGLTALLGVPRHGVRGVLLPAMAGMAINGLLLFIMVGNFIHARHEAIRGRQVALEFKSMKEAFQRDLGEMENLDLVNDRVTEFSGALQRRLAEMAASSPGGETRLFEIVKGFLAEGQRMRAKCDVAVKAVGDPEILDYGVMRMPGEYERQRRVATDYIEAFREYRLWFTNSLVHMTAELGALGEENEMAIRMLEGFRMSYNRQKPIQEMLIQAHLDYGENLLGVIDLLERYDGDWLTEGEELLLADDRVVEDFNALFRSMSANKVAIEDLNAQLVELWAMRK